MTAGNGNGRKPRLELTWIGKDEQPRLEPRILLEQPQISHAKATPADVGIHDNILIQGDNLLGLKALEQQFTGKVKCIYIDPPYNTGAAFEHYDDGVEHSLWLSLLRNRLELLRQLLHPTDGSLWVSIDDYEMPYLRLLLDEVFGRRNFIAANIWQKRYSRENREAIGDVHEYVLTYATNPECFKKIRNRIPLTEEQASIYKNPNNDPRGRWRAIPMTAQGFRTNQMYEIVAPGGARHHAPEGRCWSMLEEEFLKLRAKGRIYFGRDNNSQPNVIRYLSEVEGLVPWTWWPHDEVGHTDEAKKEMHAIFGREDAFDTPKPERLMTRVIEIATNPGDLVLDSFAGSGTTGAVAHKMGRRWIMVELGDHATTHIVPRLRKVIDGEDLGGVTETTGWKGGGGFRFYRLAPSLIETDQFGQRVISRQYKPEMLVEAMCKHMGYVYSPAQSRPLYWQQGRATERDFIYVTTQSLTHDTLHQLSLEVGPNRSLLICCKAFRARLADFSNLTVKKIPQAVLDNCEWGRDDYSLNIAKPPDEADQEPDPGPDDAGNGGEPGARTRAHRRRAGDTEPVAANGASLSQVSPRKAPLRMDGTVRPSRAARTPAPPNLSQAPIKTAAKPTPNRKPTARTAAPAPSPPATAKKKGAAKSGPAKKAQPAKTAKPKARRAAADNRQGSLL